MIPHIQTILADSERGDGHDSNGVPGNCYQTAIASALDLPTEEVPHFAALPGDEWWTESDRWLQDRGIVRGTFSNGDNDLPPTSNCPWPCTIEPRTKLWEGTEFECVVDSVVATLGSGPSPRGKFWHTVVLDPQTGKMLHDPHPSGDGLVDLGFIEVLFAISKNEVTDEG